MQINDFWKTKFRVLRRPIELARVLNLCEEYRLGEARKKRTDKEEKRKKEREADEKEAQKREAEKKEGAGKADATKKEKRKESDIEKDLKAIAWKRKRLLMKFLLAVALFFTGLLCGKMGADLETIAGLFKILFLVDIFLIAILYVRSVMHKLYDKREMIPILTMPISPLEIAMARFFQMVGKSIALMAWTLIPVWLGCSLACGFQKGMSLATLCAVICIPIFVLMALFVAVILFQLWVIALLPKNRMKSIGVPVATVAVIVGLIIILELILKDSIPIKLLNGIANALAFNVALRRMIQGELKLPFLFILVGMGLMTALFIIVVRGFYHNTLLSRGNLADDTGPSEKTIAEKIQRQRGWLWASVVREMQAIWGQHGYRVSMVMPWLVMPVLLLVFFGGLELFIPGFRLSKDMPAVEMISILFCVIVTLSCMSGLVNRAAGSVFSRDAYGLELLLVLPVDWDMLIGAKLIAACFLCVPGTVPGTLIWTCFYALAGKLPLWGIPVGLLLAVGAVVWTGEFLLMADIRRPFLKWKNLRHLIRRQKEKVLLIPVLGNFFIPLILGLILRLTAVTLPLCLGILMAYALVFPIFGGLWLFIFSVKRAELLARGIIDPDRKEGVQERLHRRLSEHL